MSGKRTPNSTDSGTSEARAIRAELDREHARNRERRLEFVKFWADYVRTHPDEEWARQQHVVIDGQVPAPDDRAGPDEGDAAAGEDSADEDTHED